MSRTAASSKWYIPLFAGTEAAQALPDLSGIVGGAVPAPPCWLAPGLKLWLNGTDNTSKRRSGAGRVYQWDDRSGLANHATQTNPTLRPLNVSDGVDFEN